MPQVSVAIFCHDRRTYLQEAVQSVLNSEKIDRSEFEIIVVKNYEDKDLEEFFKENEVRWITARPKATYGEKVKIAIEHSKGRYLALLEDDDLFSSLKLCKILEAFSSNEGIGFIRNGRRIIDSNGNFLRNEFMNRVDEIYELGSFKNDMKLLLANLKDDLRTFSSAITIDREIAHQLSEIVFPLDSLEFIPFFLSISMNKSIYFMPEQLTYYRLHNSVSNIWDRDFQTYVDRKKELIMKNLAALYVTQKIKLRDIFRRVVDIQIIDFESKLASLSRSRISLKRLLTAMSKSSIYVKMRVPSKWFFHTIVSLIMFIFPITSWKYWFIMMLHKTSH